jgi:primase-polymerase (primpol)-like protein
MRCHSCGELFAARADARYCSGRCRVRAHRSGPKSGPPLELRRLDRWVLHDKRKVPRRVDRPSWPASSTNPETWSSYADAIAVERGRFKAGIGFVLNGDGIACVDLDHCLYSDGSLEPYARRILERTPKTYVEVSPSGTGLHIFGYAEVGTGRVLDGVEVYDRGRYMTVTSNRFREFPRRLADISALVESLT